MKKVLLTTGVICFFVLKLSATHLMGGQITARQLSGLLYEVTMTNYRDTTGIPINPIANFRVQDISAGYDSTYTVPHTGMNPFFNGVEVYQYVANILLPATGQYKISWEDCCRNGAILNMSVPMQESMYLSTDVTVDAAGINSTPVFLNPPILLAQKFSMFQYNPLPFDADGDSLAWLMETPLSFNGDTVIGYTLPHADPLNPFTLNPLTGEITWMPDSDGHWEASFRVEEYRAGIKIGEIRRDMQIIVVDDTTNWHSIVFNNGSWPQDGLGNFTMTVAPNSPFNLTLTATDQDNDILALDVQGEPLVTTNNPATWSILNNIPGSVTGMFTWNPSLSQSRSLPYVLAFRGYEYHNQSVYTRDQTLMLYVNSPTGIPALQNDFTAGKLFPNPTAGNWFLSFELKKPSDVSIEVFDVTGRKIKTVLNKSMPTGTNLVESNGVNLQSGYYLVQVNVNGQKTVSYPMVIE